VSSRDREPLATEHLPGSADRVQSIGLRTVVALAGRPVELDDPLAMPFKRDGETSPVAG